MSIIISIIAAFIVTFILLPIIIKVSRSVDLLDAPDRRKIHRVSTPALGGIGIFVGFMVAVFMAVPLAELATLKFFLFGLIIIFFMGIRDDISSLMAKHKLLAQVFAAFLVVYFSDIRLTGFYGMFGIGEMPEWFSIPFTIFVLVGLTNSFNLIDGIDGLAGTIGILILSFFGWVFLTGGYYAYSVLCLSVVGSLFAFLLYNWNPSRVFMGDTGSMILGFIISSLAILFINVAPEMTLGYFEITSSVSVCIAALILPIFDTVRVFTIRFSNGKNPLDPDRNHLHHGLLKLGLNHAQATIFLALFNLLILSMALLLDPYLGNGSLMLIITAMCVGVTMTLGYKLKRKGHLGKITAVATKSSDLYISKSA